MVGGLAAVIQGAPFTTIDVDIVHDQSPENLAKLLAFLKSVNAHFRRPDDKVIKPRAEDLSGKGHALFSTRSGPQDVLAIIEEGKTYKDLLTKLYFAFRLKQAKLINCLRLVCVCPRPI